MKSNVIKFFVASLLVLSTHTKADTPGPSRMGAGIMIGSIVSITGKYWHKKTEAIDFGLGFGPSNWTAVYGDYMWHFPQLFGSSTKFSQQVTGYFGVGAGLGFWNYRDGCSRWGCGPRDNGTALFIRGLFGAEWFPGRPPLGIFLELGPFITLTPATGGSVDIGIGVRYYF